MLSQNSYIRKSEYLEEASVALLEQYWKRASVFNTKNRLALEWSLVSSGLLCLQEAGGGDWGWTYLKKKNSFPQKEKAMKDKDICKNESIIINNKCCRTSTLICLSVWFNLQNLKPGSLHHIPHLLDFH